MPFYITSPFKPTPKLMVQGTPQYLFGSLETRTVPTSGWIQSDSAATTTATVVFLVTAGNVPIAGSYVTIVGSANSAGVFNVTNALILTVSMSATVPGLATITFAITSTTQASMPDSGYVLIPQTEVGDTLTTTAASVAVVSPVSGPNSVGKSLSCTINLPASNAVVASTLSGVTVVLQGANLDLDGEYQTVGTIGTGLAAGTVTSWQSGQGVPTAPSDALSVGNVDLVNFRFYRLNATVETGSGPIVGKMLQ